MLANNTLHATELLSDLGTDKEPIPITLHGLPSAYLVDGVTLAQLQQRMKLLEGIARGERAIDDVRVVSHADAKERMQRLLK